MIMYIITLYTLNYYEDKYLSVFLRAISKKYTVKIYTHNFIHLLKISINNHALLYIRINNYTLLYTHKNI